MVPNGLSALAFARLLPSAFLKTRSAARTGPYACLSVLRATSSSKIWRLPCDKARRYPHAGTAPTSAAMTAAVTYRRVAVDNRTGRMDEVNTLESCRLAVLRAARRVGFGALRKLRSGPAI